MLTAPAGVLFHLVRICMAIAAAPTVKKTVRQTLLHSARAGPLRVLGFSRMPDLPLQTPPERGAQSAGGAQQQRRSGSQRAIRMDGRAKRAERRRFGTDGISEGFRFPAAREKQSPVGRRAGKYAVSGRSGRQRIFVIHEAVHFMTAPFGFADQRPLGAVVPDNLI